MNTWNPNAKWPLFWFEKALFWGGWPSKIEVIGALGMYKWYKYVTPFRFLGTWPRKNHKNRHDEIHVTMKQNPIESHFHVGVFAMPTCQKMVNIQICWVKAPKSQPPETRETLKSPLYSGNITADDGLKLQVPASADWSHTNAASAAPKSCGVQICSYGKCLKHVHRSPPFKHLKSKIILHDRIPYIHPSPMPQWWVHS